MKNNNHRAIKWTKPFENFLQSNGSIVVLVLLFVFCCIWFGSTFFSIFNFTNILRQISITGIAAIGVNMVIILGGRDLSVGSIATIASMSAAMLSYYGMWQPIVAAILIGILCGVINGFIITYMDVVPLIATLGTQLAFRSISLLMNNNNSLPANEELAWFAFIGRGSIFGIPTPTVIFVVLLLLAHVLLKYTNLGRSIYAIGGQEESATMMGISIKKTKMMTYILCGTLSGIAGLALCSRMGAGQPQGATNWGMEIMAIVVIGGTRMRGGKGSILGVIVGAIIMGLISNMINMFGNINQYWQNVISGCLLLIAVIAQTISEERMLQRVNLKVEEVKE